MNEPVTHQPTNDFGTEIHNNLQGLGKLTNTKELTIHLRRPKPIDCEYFFLSCILGCTVEPSDSKPVDNKLQGLVNFLRL